MRGITLVKIAHGVFGALGAFHVFAGLMLDLKFQYTAPRAPNPFTHQTVRWQYSDSDEWFSGTAVVYITDADYAKWQAFTAVGIVFLLICGALYLYLKHAARRDGRTSIY